MILNDAYKEERNKLIKIAQLSKGMLVVATIDWNKGILGFSIIDHERERIIVFGYVDKILNYFVKEGLEYGPGRLRDLTPIGSPSSSAWDDYQLILEKIEEHDFLLSKKS